MLEELRVEVLGTTGEKEVDLNAVAFFQEIRDFPGLNFQVMISRADLHLDALGLGSACFNPLMLFVLEVLILAEVHDLGHWRQGVRRDFNQIKAGLQGGAERFSQRQDTEIGAIVTDNAELLGPDEMINFNLVGQLFADRRLPY